ncbi:MAG: NADH-quinone oxidoreductase subunit J [Ottowia sp.]|nr:NADH-quinone oxidoreductase subunit J [Ottowia sp.]
MTKALFFYLFSFVMLLAAFRVVTARNPVHAVLYLMLTFSQAAGLWLLLEAEFLAIALVLVYLGAVMVLFLFVVMMLDIPADRSKREFWRRFPQAFLIGALLAVEMAAAVSSGFDAGAAPATPLAIETASGHSVPYSNTRALGILLYTEYLYPVEIAAVLLLIAMVAAIALTLRQRRDRKIVQPSEQVRVRASERLKVLHLAPATRDVSAGAEPAQEGAHA